MPTVAARRSSVAHSGSGTKWVPSSMREMTARGRSLPARNASSAPSPWANTTPDQLAWRVERPAPSPSPQGGGGRALPPPLWRRAGVGVAQRKLLAAEIGEERQAPPSASRQSHANAFSERRSARAGIAADLRQEGDDVAAAGVEQALHQREALAVAGLVELLPVEPGRLEGRSRRSGRGSARGSPRWRNAPIWRIRVRRPSRTGRRARRGNR